ncbi:MAG: hypothetical protein K2N47_00895, partial [Clostridia bacterium]|nr:hypothetical protein [Clostridia bacterium]
VINNIKNSASLYIMKTLFTAILAALCIALPKVFQYPFMTQHMLLLEMFVIGVPSFFLSLQPNNARVEGKFIPHVMSRSVPGAVVMILNVIAMYLVCYYDTSFSTYQTALCTIALTCSGLVMLYRICQPLNWFRVILFAAMAAVSITVLSVPVLTNLIMNDKNWANATWDYAKILIVVVAIEASFPLSSWLIKIMQIIMPSSTEKKKSHDEKKKEKQRIR